MTVIISIKNIFARCAMLGSAFIVLGLLVRIVLAEFIAGTLVDTRLDTSATVLSAAAEYLPNSARLFARLAEAEMTGPNIDLPKADTHARRAVSLSPQNYNYRLLLASILEARGDQAAAELAIKDALAIAPNYAEINWRLGNLQLRMGRLNEAVEQFRIVANANQKLVPAMLELLWNASGHDIRSLKTVADGNSQAELSLARFFADHVQIPETVDILSKLDRDIVLKSSDTSPLIDSMIKNGYPKAASTLCQRLLSVAGEPALVWNGDLEAEEEPGQPRQFDWRLKDSDFARARIDKKVARSGSSSLLIDFAGKNTTRLMDEVQQLIVLEPGVQYRMEWWVKTQQFQSPEGPRVVLTDKTGKPISTSDPVMSGSNDWTRMTLSFTAPGKGADDGTQLTISVRREPHFTYDQPTRGQIWFDDFSISRAGGK